VGNVAGEAHPIVAEGISMAIQSGAMLAEFLSASQDGLGEAQVLERTARAYAAAWRRQFSGRIRAAAAFARLAMRPELTGAISSTVETLPSLLTLGALLAGKSKPYGSNAP
jgi:flavin-dependent dehydrogenase